MTTLADFLLARIAESEKREDDAWINYEGRPPKEYEIEYESKRRIVAACDPIYGTDGWEYDDAPELAYTTLRLLALPYADHPDYREEWRV